MPLVVGPAQAGIRFFRKAAKNGDPRAGSPSVGAMEVFLHDWRKTAPKRKKFPVHPLSSLLNIWGYNTCKMDGQLDFIYGIVKEARKAAGYTAPWPPQ
jgi:hypothetical protein